MFRLPERSAIEKALCNHSWLRLSGRARKKVRFISDGPFEVTAIWLDGTTAHHVVYAELTRTLWACKRNVFGKRDHFYRRVSPP